MKMSISFVSDKSFRLSSPPPKVEQEVAPMVIEKPGIVSILGPYSQVPKPVVSFRRTLSADMSSKKWLAQHGFKSPAMKKIASSQQLSIISAVDSSSSSDEEDEEFKGKKHNQNLKQNDMWSSIISQNKTQELPPPYVHPLVKKASNTLSKKSLEICTESLGSETGSEAFSYPTSEADDLEKVEEQSKQEEKLLQELPAVAKYNYTAGKKVQSRSFPPPLPSLVRSSEGPSLHMQSNRVNGRLVLEAISVPSTKNFHAQRHDGRLRLTLVNNKDQELVQQSEHDEEIVLDQKGVDFEEMFEIFKEEEDNEIERYEDDDDGEEEMAEEIEKEINGPQGMEQVVPKMTTGLINIHRSALMMKKLVGNENQNPARSHRFKLVEDDEINEDEMAQLPQSLPPRPPVARLIPCTPEAAAASFNAYEYFWRAKPLATSLKSQLTNHCPPITKNNTNNKLITSNKPKGYEQQVTSRNCKETRRSLLSWEAYCIATS